jgi:hypothetical protein
MVQARIQVDSLENFRYVSEIDNSVQHTRTTYNLYSARSQQTFQTSKVRNEVSATTSKEKPII